ncbi:MAG: zinc ABC transporter substrate-binding protein [Gammaproteobacteria bacterium 39-13]|nr:MAG: zinc ABC transporter substrate-binding protein [Gammaproteobacteria bacterium 39-13]
MKTAVKYLFLTGYFLTFSANAALKVFACEPEWADLAKTIGGKHVMVTQATTARQDPHQIEARPTLLASARKADILVCTGAELEDGWLPLIQQKVNNPKILPGQPGHFMAANFIKLLDVPREIDRIHGDIHAQGNPHIQLDPQNYIVIAKALSQRLEQLDPIHAHTYRENALAFINEWEKAIQQWTVQAEILKGMPVVTYHHSWVYLNNWLGLKQIATLEPKPGIPPSAAHLNEILNQVKNQNIKAILCSPYESQEAAKWLSKKINAPIVMLPFTVGGTENTKDLKSLFDVTIEKLTIAAQ